MKRSIIILSFILCSGLVFGQTPSYAADSIARMCIKKLPSNGKRTIYESLVSGRQRLDLYARMDTIKYDYLYIEETYIHSDSTTKVSEFYFNAPGSVFKINYEDRNILPDIVYRDGKLVDQRYTYYSSTTTGVLFHGIYEYYYTLDTILLRCKSLLPFQEVSYDSTPPITNYITTNSRYEVDTSSARKTESEKKYVDALKSTYQIVTLIDRTRNKVIVSVQLPAQNPKIHSYVMKFEYHQW